MEYRNTTSCCFSCFLIYYRVGTGEQSGNFHNSLKLPPLYLTSHNRHSWPVFTATLITIWDTFQWSRQHCDPINSVMTGDKTSEAWRCKYSNAESFQFWAESVKFDNNTIIMWRIRNMPILLELLQAAITASHYTNILITLYTHNASIGESHPALIIHILNDHPIRMTTEFTFDNVQVH